ncbi:MAG: hypothetical protein JOZ13_12355 [Alphaproteobacteria bacterium]|nr:hypothetical protein [Alphaproteobacteria bacterium]
MSEVRRHLKRANINQPVVDAAALARSIPSKAKSDVGDTKREEVGFLILSGLPHKEVVKRAPFARRGTESAPTARGQVLESTGGPTRAKLGTGF